MLFREMFHARRYHSNFPSPMIIHKSSHIYVNDFVKFEHTTLGISTGKVLSYYIVLILRFHLVRKVILIYMPK